MMSVKLLSTLDGPPACCAMLWQFCRAVRDGSLGLTDTGTSACGRQEVSDHMAGASDLDGLLQQISEFHHQRLSRWYAAHGRARKHLAASAAVLVS